MQEYEVQTKLSRFFKNGGCEVLFAGRGEVFSGALAIELKVDHRRGRVAFSQIEDHQIATLEAIAYGNGYGYKISDSAIGVKPFDFFYMERCNAFIAFFFEGSLCLYLFDIKTALKRLYCFTGGSRRRARGSFSEEEVARGAFACLRLKGGKSGDFVVEG